MLMTNTQDIKGCDKESTLIKLSEGAQELLEQLWIATQEEGQASLQAEGDLSESVDELARQGLVEVDNGGVRLTALGLPEAAQAVRRHRLAERLLTDVLSTPEALMDEQACRFEHVLVDGVDEHICTLLGHPRFCPHGKPIPPGACCARMQASAERLIAPLCDLEPGQRGQIAYIRMDEPKRLQKLMAMGVLPGVPIGLLRRFPSFVFEAGYSQFAVDRDIAADIFVRLTQASDRSSADQGSPTEATQSVSTRFPRGA
jgi:DtxR family Mn-dependent transcriptional regulator